MYDDLPLAGALPSRFWGGFLLPRKGKWLMENRIALLGIVVEEPSSVEPLNALLHAYGEHIIGRMGIPHRERHISVISVVLDAPGDAISTLAGKVGQLPGVSAKTLYAKLNTP